MSSSKNPNKTTALALNEKAIEGVQKYFAHVKTLTIAGTTYTPTTLTAVLQAEIDAEKALAQGQAVVKQQVVAARLARSKGQATRQGLKAYVLSTSGTDAAQMLEDFGISVPKKPGFKSAKAKAKAVDAAETTRQRKKEALASIDAAAPPAPAVPAATVTPTK